MASVIGGTIAAIRASSRTLVIRRKDLMAPVSVRARGERLQEILGEVVDEQGHDQVLVKPTSRASVCSGADFVGPDQGFQSLEREFDVPSQTIDGQNFLRRIVVHR